MAASFHQVSNSKKTDKTFGLQNDACSDFRISYTSIISSFPDIKKFTEINSELEGCHPFKVTLGIKRAKMQSLRILQQLYHEESKCKKKKLQTVKKKFAASKFFSESFFEKY